MSSSVDASGKRPGRAERDKAATPQAGEQVPPEGPEKTLKRLPKTGASRAERTQMVKDARAISFPVVLRGYRRAAVDRYVEQVNRLIAELEVSSSPEAAVRHALAEVSEETREILQRAHATADEMLLRSRATCDETVRAAEREAHEITNTARREAIDTLEAAHEEARVLGENARGEAAELRETATREAAELTQTTARETETERTAAVDKADKLLASAREEADEVLRAAETRARDLADNADSIWRERRRLIEDVRLLGEQLTTLAENEADRFQKPTTKSEHAQEPRRARLDLAAPLEDAIENATPEHPNKTHIRR